MQKNTYIVSVYETDRVKGGNEEGGWWFDVGTPYQEPEAIALLRVFTDLEKAKAYRDEIKATVTAWNELEGRRDPNSVLCNGWLEVFIDENELPTPYPKEHPHYE